MLADHSLRSWSAHDTHSVINIILGLGTRRVDQAERFSFGGSGRCRRCRAKGRRVGHKGLALWNPVFLVGCVVDVQSSHFARDMAHLVDLSMVMLWLLLLLVGLVSCISEGLELEHVCVVAD